MNEFSENVWELTRRIPKGRVSTYGRLARALGRPGASRAIGQALKRNPYAAKEKPGLEQSIHAGNPIVVPCHRVVRSDGGIGGYAGRSPAKIGEKARLLESEGVEISGGKVMNMKERLFRFV